METSDGGAPELVSRRRSRGAGSVQQEVWSTLRGMFEQMLIRPRVLGRDARPVEPVESALPVSAGELPLEIGGDVELGGGGVAREAPPPHRARASFEVRCSVAPWGVGTTRLPSVTGPLEMGD